MSSETRESPTTAAPPDCPAESRRQAMAWGARNLAIECKSKGLSGVAQWEKQESARLRSGSGPTVITTAAVTSMGHYKRPTGNGHSGGQPSHFLLFIIVHRWFYWCEQNTYVPSTDYNPRSVRTSRVVGHTYAAAVRHHRSIQCVPTMLQYCS
jgi:hypothetical protein